MSRLDRLVEVRRAMEQWTYRYDAFNRRLSRTCHTRTSEDASWVEQDRLDYLYEGQRDIGACTQDGTLKELRLLGYGLGAELGAAVAIEIEDSVYVPIHDHIGHVVALLNSDGTLAESYRYSAFGEESIYDSDGENVPLSHVDNPWRFASKRADRETGFVNFGRRYYDPETGRWLTPDPRGYEDGPNLYAYVHNRPLTHFDLYGLSARCQHCGRRLDYYRGRWTPRDAPRGRAWYHSRGSRSCSPVANNIQRLGRWRDSFIYHATPIRPFQQVLLKCSSAMQGRGFTVPLEYQPQHSHVLTYAGTVPEHSNTLFLNGQNWSEEDHRRFLADTSQKLGGKSVDGVYGSCHGIVADGGESVGIIAGFPSDFVDKAAQAIQHRLRASGDAVVNIIAESQGAAALDQALKRISPADQARLNIITFGAAKLINNNYVYGCKNYVHRRDPVPFLADTVGYFKALCGLQKDVHFIGKWGTPTFKEHSLSNGLYNTVLNNELRNIRADNRSF